MKVQSMFQRMVLVLVLGVMANFLLPVSASFAGNYSCGEGVTCMYGCTEAGGRVCDGPPAGTCTSNSQCGPGETCVSGNCQCTGTSCNSVPEMGEYLAIALLLMGAGFIVYKRRQIKVD